MNVFNIKESGKTKRICKPNGVKRVIEWVLSEWDIDQKE
jgi:hypothetical protein